MAAVFFRPEDQVFVQIAIEECIRFNLQKHAPTALIWNSRIPADQAVLHEGYLMMPEALNGKIVPQDARPLIMSAILQKELVKRRNPPDRYLVLLNLLSTFSFLGATFALILTSSGPSSNSVGGELFLIWLMVVFAGSILLRLWNNRKQRLESDLQVAQLIETQFFSRTLTKIEGLNILDKHNRVRSLMSGWPTLCQRIVNLKNPSLPWTEKEAFEAYQRRD